MTPIISFVILAVYLTATSGFLGYILFRRFSLLRFAFWLTIAGLALHTIWLANVLIANGYPFILSNRDAYILVAWTVSTLYVLLSRFYHFQAAGAFFLPIAICFLILGLFGTGDYEFGVATIISPWVVIHLFLAFMAFSVFLVSFVIGIAFIVLEFRIKSKELGGLERKLPPLEVLDGIHYKALGLGLVVLSAAIIAGTILNKVIQGAFFTWDPKQLWVIFTWILYAILLQMRVKVGWRGRRGIFLSVLGFMIVVMAFFGLQHGPTI